MQGLQCRESCLLSAWGSKRLNDGNAIPDHLLLKAMPLSAKDGPGSIPSSEGLVSAAYGLLVVKLGALVLYQFPNHLVL